MNHLGDTNKMVSETPRTDGLLTEILDAYGYVHQGNCPQRWVNHARELERELNAANDRIKRLEEALGLVLKMRNDWLENQEDGYEGAYYAFVKGNDSEWEEIIKAKEAKL